MKIILKLSHNDSKKLTDAQLSELQTYCDVKNYMIETNCDFTEVEDIEDEHAIEAQKAYTTLISILENV